MGLYFGVLFTHKIHAFFLHSNYKLRFKTLSQGALGNVAVDSLIVSDGVCQLSKGVCDFENGQCGYVQDLTGLRWMDGWMVGDGL